MEAERPLTSQMLKSLYECYIRETGGKPSNPFNTKSCKGLLQRGMIEILPYQNGSKLKDALYITRSGREAITAVLQKLTA
ncbi:MAG: hypothetical protein M3R50_00725 [Bacteroidota bacterium]|nr:hypothetical protein [Bacteroidota bacterium]